MKDKQQLKNGEEVVIRACTVEDVDDFLVLQEEVIQSLPVSSFFQPLSKEEFIHILTGNGHLLGAYSNEELVAFRAFLIPSIEEPEHLAEDAKLEQAVWDQVIYSEVSNVKPSFQGNGLQKILGERLMAQINQKKFRYVCATVAPFNIASLIDKFTQGLKIVALKEKYGGALRYVFLRDLQEEELKVRASIEVQMNQIEEQQNLLEKGWHGVGIEKKEEEWFVVYQQ